MSYRVLSYRVWLPRFGPPTLILLGSLWLLQGVFARTGSHGVLLRNLHYDAGPVKAGATVTDTVRLINLSPTPVKVDAQPGCGCTVADVPDKPLAPLHSEVVQLEVDTDGMQKGQQQRGVLLKMQSGEKNWEQVAKVRMKQRQGRIAPVLMALGLWLLGNSLLGMQSAKGQEVTGAFQVPVPVPYTYQTSNHCLATPQGYCQRRYQDIWGCKTSMTMSSCPSVVIRPVSDSLEQCNCTATSDKNDICDWSTFTIISETDACEQSSKATGQNPNFNCPTG